MYIYIYILDNGSFHILSDVIIYIVWYDNYEFVDSRTTISRSVDLRDCVMLVVYFVGKSSSTMDHMGYNI